MASTRDVIAPPIFAEDASTTIPTTPIAGQSYRDPVAGPASSADGWPYAQLVNSAEFNQLMFQWSSLLSIMDLKGVLGWSSLKDYTEPAIAFGSDGKVYKWLQESGPDTAAGAKDPISNPLYWEVFGEDQADSINAAVATVAASGTIDLTAGAPSTSQISISGTGVSINGFTVAANRFFVVKMTGASNTLVNSASLVTGRGANIPVVAGDCFLMRSTAANTVEIVGGTFLIDRGVGSGQTLQNLTASRSSGVTYTNTTGRTISVSISGTNPSGIVGINLTIAGVVTAAQAAAANQSASVFGLVAHGETYSCILGGVSLYTWSERRT